jgi:hypothetical protein
MKLMIEIRMENAAFEDDPREEVKAVLSRCVRSMNLSDTDSIALRDSNGNTCGWARVRED